MEPDKKQKKNKVRDTIQKKIRPRGFRLSRSCLGQQYQNKHAHLSRQKTPGRFFHFVFHFQNIYFVALSSIKLFLVGIITSLITASTWKLLEKMMLR